MQTLTDSKKLFRNPLQRSCCGIEKAAMNQKFVQKPHVILKIVPKAGCDMYTIANLPMREKEIRNKNSDAAFGTVFRIS
jgi:hypothetical protein